MPSHPGWLEEVAVNFEDGNIQVTFGVEELDSVSDDDLRELCDVFRGYIFPWRPATAALRHDFYIWCSDVGHDDWWALAVPE